MLNICIVAGARPNFIKIAPLVRAIERGRAAGQPVDYQLVYTGTETDPALEPGIFDDLQMPRPDTCLGVDCISLNELTGRVMAAFEQYLDSHPADVVIVVDDLASTMAAAIVTKKRGLRLAHLVAGTRSFDMKMPKEINRLVIDGLSDYLFTAGVGSNSIATREGAELSQIYMVGNILIDNLRFNYGRLQRPAVLDRMDIKDGSYLVFTLNRKALLSDEANLRSMLLAMLEAAGGIPVIAPLRDLPRATVERLFDDIKRSSPGLQLSPLVSQPSMSYLEFGYLAAHAHGVITDSGNVAEEATFNNVPCITLNSYTEHIETVKQGSNVLVGEDAERLRAALRDLLDGRWKKCSLPERWDGRTAERIVQILQEY